MYCKLHVLLQTIAFICKYLINSNQTLCVIVLHFPRFLHIKMSQKQNSKDSSKPATKEQSHTIDDLQLWSMDDLLQALCTAEVCSLPNSGSF